MNTLQSKTLGMLPHRLWRRMQIWRGMRLLSQIRRRSDLNKRDYAVAQRLLTGNVQAPMPLMDWADGMDGNGR